MQSIFMATVVEVSQEPRVAKMVVGSGAMISTGTILEWLPVVVGIFASITTIVFTIFLFYSHWKKMLREEEKHEEEMALIREKRASFTRIILK